MELSPTVQLFLQRAKRIPGVNWEELESIREDSECTDQ